MDATVKNKSHLPLTAIKNKIPQMKTLFIDPNITCYYLICALLEEFETEIIYASSGKEAINKFMKTPSINLVITEIRLPDTDGFEVLDTIRSKNHSVAFIAQTAFACKNISQKCIEAGFDEHIFKPIDVKAFKKTIIKYLKS